MIAPCRAQMPESADAVSQGNCCFGTKEAPPFAMKAPEAAGKPRIDHGAMIADDLYLHNRFVEEPD